MVARTFMSGRSYGIACLLALFLLSLSAACVYAQASGGPGAAGAGAITGAVTDLATSAPLPGVEVKACAWGGAGGCTGVATARTDAAGGYALLALPEGDYRVCFAIRTHDAECYDDWPDGGLGTKVHVGAGETVAGIHAALANKGRIRGRVTDAATGEGLAGAGVWVYRGMKRVVQTTTDGQGLYEADGLNAGGDYRLLFYDPLPTSAPQPVHAERFYKDARSFDTANLVSVGIGETVEGIDVALPLLGRITGQVTSRATGAASAGITVSLYVPNVGNRKATTDAAGRYEFGNLVQGSYTLYFTDPAKNYVSVYYGGATNPNGVPVSVRDGEVTAGIDQALPDRGAIAGQVVDAATGAPLPGIAMTAELWPSYVTVVTDAEGRAMAGQLEAGGYWVHFTDPSGAYREDHQSGITVLSGQTTEVRAALESAYEAPRTVRGRVTAAATGAVLGGVRVALGYWYHHWKGYDVWDEFASTLTANDGTYEFPNAPWAERVYVTDSSRIYADGFAPYAYPPAGETVVVDVALVTNLSKYGRVSGRVTGSTGAPLAEAWARFWPQGVDNYLQAAADANGDYEIFLPPGVYRIEFYEGGIFEGEWHPDAPTREAAQDVTVEVGQQLVIDAVLTEMGRISGVVTDSDGKPLPNAWVSLYYGPEHLEWSSAVGTDAEGRYVTRPLYSGVWRVLFQHADYDHLVYGGGTEIAGGMPITVTAGQPVAGINGALVPLGWITGRVTDAGTGEPVAGIQVLGKTTDGAGQFASRSHSGAYNLIFTDPQGRYPQQTYGSKVQVTSPLTTTVEMALKPGGRVVGLVTDVNGAPLAGIRVSIARDACCWGRQVFTDEAGAYDSGPLVDKENYGDGQQYFVQFFDPSNRYRLAYYGGSLNKDEAARIPVTPGEIVTANGQLDAWGRITGVVTDAETGAPIQGAKVWVWTAKDRTEQTFTDAAGRYTLEGLPAGETTLTFEDARRHAPVARRVMVALNAMLAGEDASLGPWGAIGGRVTDAVMGKAVAGAWVYLQLYTTAGYEGAGATVTDVNGAYRFTPPQAGKYRVYFTHPRRWYLPQYWPGASTPEEASTVTFAPGQVYGAIDVALAWSGDGPPVEDEGVRVWLPVIGQ